MGDRRGLGTYITDEEELTTGNLDYFTVAPPENVLRNGTTIELNTANNFLESGPFEFHINEDPEHYIYLPMTRLHMELRIVKADGADWTLPQPAAAEGGQAPANDSNALISHCNLLPHAMFRQIEIDINGVAVNDLSSSLYPIKSFMETVMSYGKDACDTHLKMLGYAKDTPGSEHSIANNAALTSRRDLIVVNKTFFFNTPLHCDFFQMERFIPPNSKITIKIIRNMDSFPLISTGNLGKIQIKALKMYIHKIKIDEGFDKAIEARMLKEPALFPITQSKLKSFLIANGTQTLTITNIINGKLPRSIIIGFLHADSYNGILHKNPFTFNHFNLNMMNLKINGRPFTATPIRPNYANGDFLREYRRFLDHSGVHHSNHCLNITLEDFENNMNFYPFDFSPDLCNATHMHATNNGYIDVDLGWSTGLTHNIYMIVYASYTQTIALDEKRNVKVLE